ncbi:BolA family protein [Candidatus Annandia pinicola]|uniref:BolA family transcriptional regulator n=1 Tax=Candidatus Annandia pinicola TaxID=1345117 RepID=UPI001D020B7D|nr:BolA family transcriptional regulator [Candidatus Annandia pinicola]UDG80280.1 Acid stress protein IbaG [Candidatus Annandia pinicola]
MEKEKIYCILSEKLKLKKIYVNGDNSNFNIIAIDDIFKKLDDIEKQKIIYKPLFKYILKKKIHSISIESYSIKEWKKKINLNINK